MLVFARGRAVGTGGAVGARGRAGAAGVLVFARGGIRSGAGVRRLDGATSRVLSSMSKPPSRIDASAAGEGSCATVIPSRSSSGAPARVGSSVGVRLRVLGPGEVLMSAESRALFVERSMRS